MVYLWFWRVRCRSVPLIETIKQNIPQKAHLSAFLFFYAFYFFLIFFPQLALLHMCHERSLQAARCHHQPAGRRPSPGRSSPGRRPLPIAWPLVARQPSALPHASPAHGGKFPLKRLPPSPVARPPIGSSSALRRPLLPDLPLAPARAIPAALHFSCGGGVTNWRWWCCLGWAASVMARRASLWPEFRWTSAGETRWRMEAEISALQLLLRNRVYRAKNWWFSVLRAELNAACKFFYDFAMFTVSDQRAKPEMIHDFELFMGLEML
jgi:hypothetical protein